MSNNHFWGRPDNPYHISVGAVLVNDQGQIACHHFDAYHTKRFGDLENLYLLMRESLEDNETLEAALARGLQEEFAATATFDRFLGTIVSHFPGREEVEIEKTTPYFLLRLETIDLAQRPADDEEAHSTVGWEDPHHLITYMRDQAARYPNRTDLDEAKIVEAYLATIAAQA